MSSDEFKAEGNRLFIAKDYTGAAQSFTKAIDASPLPNHVLYSNRSAAYAMLKDFDKALKDAEQCIAINPSWAKGYSRLAAAQFGSGDLEFARGNYLKAYEMDGSAMAKEGLDAVNAALRERNEEGGSVGSIFADPQFLDKVRANPKGAALLRDPELAAKAAMCQANPNMAGTLMNSEPRLMHLMAALLGVNIDNVKVPEPASQQPNTTAPLTGNAESTPQDPEPMQVDSAKAEADAAKAEGNTLYKAHKFDEAIAAYDKAWSLHKDITYLNNRAAAEYEKGDYDAAIESCNKAIDEGRQVHADYKVIAKSFARVGNAYMKKDDLHNAVKFFDKSLTEHRTPDVLNKLRALQREIKKREAESYIDADKAEEARLEGKECFTKSDWPGAVRAYTEMTKRAPEDARGYSNRAAALMKLLSFPDAVRDCDAAIAKDPNFIRAYIRKANAQVAMKDYAQALETLNDAREKDVTLGSTNIAEIDQVYQRAMSQRFQNIEGETPEQTMERVSRDPEIVSILQDPVMQGILSQARDNPQALQEHMRNPNVSKKVEMLIAAGVIRTR